MTPRPMFWPALGELVGSTLVPLPGPWAWTLCTFTGTCGSGTRVLGWGAGVRRCLTLPRSLSHRHSGLLSALGLALADVVHEAQEPCSLPYAPETFMQLDQRLSCLEEQCVDALRAQGFPRWGARGGLGGTGPGQGLYPSAPPPRWIDRPISQMVLGPMGQWSRRAGEGRTGVPLGGPV